MDNFFNIWVDGKIQLSVVRKKAKKLYDQLRDTDMLDKNVTDLHASYKWFENFKIQFSLHTAFTYIIVSEAVSADLNPAKMFPEELLVYTEATGYIPDQVVVKLAFTGKK